MKPITAKHAYALLKSERVATATLPLLKSMHAFCLYVFGFFFDDVVLFSVPFFILCFFFDGIRMLYLACPYTTSMSLR